MHDDAVHLLERGGATHAGIEHREENAAQDEGDNRREDQDASCGRVRRDSDSAAHLLVHLIVHLHAKRFHLSNLRLEERLPAGFGRHRQHRARDHNHRGEREHAEPLRMRGNRCERVTRRGDDADKTRRKTLRGRDCPRLDGAIGHKLMWRFARDRNGRTGTNDSSTLEIRRKPLPRFAGARRTTPCNWLTLGTDDGTAGFDRVR